MNDLRGPVNMVRVERLHAWEADYPRIAVHPRMAVHPWTAKFDNRAPLKSTLFVNSERFGTVEVSHKKKAY